MEQINMVQIRARGVLVRIIQVKPLIYRRELRAKIPKLLEISQDTPADFHFYYTVSAAYLHPSKKSTVLICKQITQGYDRELTKKDKEEVPVSTRRSEKENRKYVSFSSAC